VRAIEVIYRAAGDGAPKERCAALIERSWGGVSGAILQADAPGRERISNALGRLMTDDLLTTSALLNASQAFHQLQQHELAAEGLRRLPPEVLAEPGPARDWALNFMRTHVRRLLTRSKFEEAIGLIEEIRRLSGTTGDAQYPLAHLARAAAARADGNFRRALEITSADLEPSSPQIARNRVVYTVHVLLEKARETTKWSEALAHLEPIRNSYPMEYRLAANELIEYEVRDALDRGDVAEVLRIVDTVPPGDRSAALVAFGKQAFYEAESARIGEDSPLELMKLGRWCADNGLYREAILVLTKVRGNAAVSELADELIGLARMRRDTLLLEEANAAYGDGRLEVASEKVREIIADQGRASLLEPEARKLQGLIDKAAVREKERRPYDAEVLYQRAERAYYLQSLEESFNLLALVLRDYPETPAARRAATLQPDVLRSLEIAFLEGKPIAISRLRAEVPLERIQKADKLAEEIARLLEALGSEEP
jgi:tetratricopeptide (TPR) repeat protein